MTGQGYVIGGMIEAVESLDISGTERQDVTTPANRSSRIDGREAAGETFDSALAFPPTRPGDVVTVPA